MKKPRSRVAFPNDYLSISASSELSMNMWIAEFGR